MSAGAIISIICGAIAMACGVASILIADAKRDLKKLRTMSDAELIANGLWDECDGEPTNIYADEFERRNAILAKELA